jgi:16S rRNA (uracil1498-N3)-methyltransferase
VKQLVLPPEAAESDQVALRGADYHYLAHVRRLVEKDLVSALSGSVRLTLEVLSKNSEELRFQVIKREPTASAPVSLTLFPFLLKSGKLDDVIRQACEAGVAQIVPVQGDHSIGRLEPSDTERKLERWNAIARQAAQQSGGPLCQVFAPVASRVVPGWWDAQGPLLVFHQVPVVTPGLAPPSLHRYLAQTPAQVGLIVGPEGGLSPSELAELRASGALPVWLGPSVLRAETASVHALAAVKIILQERSEWTITPPESHA